MTAFAAGYGL